MWLERTPQIYREKLTQCLSLLEESNFWLDRCIVNERDEAIGLDYLDQLQIDNLSNSVLHQSYASLCGQLHDLCPHNLYLKFALLRLYKSYALALDTIDFARDIHQCDKIDYLKRITRDIF